MLWYHGTILVVSDTCGTIDGSGLSRYLHRYLKYLLPSLTNLSNFVNSIFFFEISRLPRCLFERAHAIKCSLVKKVGTLTV